MTKNEMTSNTFIADDRRAENTLERKRDDLARARKLSPALVASLDSEIEACEEALERARQAAHEYDREVVELARAEVLRKATLTALNTSHEVDPDAADRIVLDAERAKYLEGARKRRADAARDAANSAYQRAAKDITERNNAVSFSERLANAVGNREQEPSESRPLVLAWTRLTLPNEGREAYRRLCESRRGPAGRSFPTPPPIEEFDRACARVFAAVEHERAKAAKLAADLAAITAAE